GFGTNFLDADLDSKLDIFITNGHILDNVELYSDSITYRQTPFLFENLGRCRFRDVSSTSGPYFRSKDVGRGSAVGDLDHDGAPDLVVSANNLPAHVLLNRTPRSSRHWIALRLSEKRGGDALGARVEVVAGGNSHWAQVRSASSYLSQGDTVVELGLGDARTVEQLRVWWSGGKMEEFPSLPADHYYLIREGAGSSQASGPGTAWKR
ncbi:MAG: CRTAC1 family protein, partial [Acidobacteria bacterium]|nr:CRTAC1 family protein [Acidobacteriota bacterium]